MKYNASEGLKQNLSSSQNHILRRHMQVVINTNRYKLSYGITSMILGQVPRHVLLDKRAGDHDVRCLGLDRVDRLAVHIRRLDSRTRSGSGLAHVFVPIAVAGPSQDVVDLQRNIGADVHALACRDRCHRAFAHGDVPRATGYWKILVVLQNPTRLSSCLQPRRWPPNVCPPRRWPVELGAAFVVVRPATYGLLIHRHLSPLRLDGTLRNHRHVRRERLTVLAVLAHLYFLRLRR